MISVLAVPLELQSKITIQMNMAHKRDQELLISFPIHTQLKTDII